MKYRHGSFRGQWRKEYRAWSGMKNRCYNDNEPGYATYGAIGITVCDRWINSFENFLSDMGKCPIGYSLDRIDFTGNYEPENCRWADPITQANNKSNNTMITYLEKTKSVASWCRDLKLSYHKIRQRIVKCGWSAEKAFTTP